MSTLLASLRKHRFIFRVTLAGAGLCATGAWAYFVSGGSGIASAGVGALSQPTISSASAGAGTVALHWSSVSAPGSGTVRYYVTRDGLDPAGTCAGQGSASADTSCTDAGVGVGDHTYRVIAVWRTWSAASPAQPVDVRYEAIAQLAFTTEPVGGAAGDVLSTQPVVTAQDASGRTVADYTGTVALSIKSGTRAADGKLVGCSSLTLNDGVGAFSGCEIDAAANGYRLHGTDGSLSADSAGFDVSAAAPSKLVFTSAALNGPASATASLGPATVQEQDRFGNPTTSALTVQLSSDSAGGGILTNGSLTIPSTGAAISAAAFTYTTDGSNSWSTEKLTAATGGGATYNSAVINISK